MLKNSFEKLVWFFHHVNSISRNFSWNWFHGNSQILYFQISTCVTVLFMVSLYFLRQQWVCVSNLKVSRFNRYSVILIFGFFFNQEIAQEVVEAHVVLMSDERHFSIGGHTTVFTGPRRPLILLSISDNHDNKQQPPGRSLYKLLFEMIFCMSVMSYKRAHNFFIPRSAGQKI